MAMKWYSIDIKMSDQKNQFGNSNKCFSKVGPRETVEVRT